MPACVLLQAAPPAGDPYLAELLRTLLAVLATGVLAFVALRYLQRRGLGAAKGAAAAVRVIGRVPLEPRKSLYLVRVGDRVLLIGTGEAGAPALLAELDPRDLEVPSAGTAATGSGAAPGAAER